MKLVVGLGNPGRKYEGTRHNLGFEVVSCLARRHAAAPPSPKFHAEVTDIRCGQEQVLLVCPNTFMNRSGLAVQAVVEFYKLELSQILVVCDDLNLDLGRLRFRAKGSAGGQKGLVDVIRLLGTDEWSRLRVGIGEVAGAWDAADYVLSRFTKAEVPIVQVVIEQAATAVEDWVRHGVALCMNRYNGQ